MCFRRSRHQPSRMPLGSVVLVGLLGLVAGVTGCASPEAPGATDAAVRFATLAGTSPAAACALLAPRTRESLAEDGRDCAGALTEAGLPSTAADGGGSGAETEVAGNGARVRLPSQVVFLARFDEGWRVTAAGCSLVSADPAIPYDCAVEG